MSIFFCFYLTELVECLDSRIRCLRPPRTANADSRAFVVLENNREQESVPNCSWEQGKERRD